MTGPLNISHIIGTGNQAVLGPGDYLEALLDDDRVRAIGMYLEGLDDIDQFSRAAVRALAKGVPIVVMKIGRTQSGRGTGQQPHQRADRIGHSL